MEADCRRSLAWTVGRICPSWMADEPSPPLDGSSSLALPVSIRPGSGIYDTSISRYARTGCEPGGCTHEQSGVLAQYLFIRELSVSGRCEVDRIRVRSGGPPGESRNSRLVVDSTLVSVRRFRQRPHATWQSIFHPFGPARRRQQRRRRRERRAAMTISASRRRYQSWIPTMALVNPRASLDWRTFGRYCQKGF